MQTWAEESLGMETEDSGIKFRKKREIPPDLTGSPNLRFVSFINEFYI